MPTCLPAPTPSRQALLLDRQNAGSVPTLSLARCPPARGHRLTSRGASSALGEERRQGPSWQMVPTCRDRCRPRLCRKFSFEVIWGMLSPDDPG
jgi:hypothetical protein